MCVWSYYQPSGAIIRMIVCMYLDAVVFTTSSILMGTTQTYYKYCCLYIIIVRCTLFEGFIIQAMSIILICLVTGYLANQPTGIAVISGFG